MFPDAGLWVFIPTSQRYAPVPLKSVNVTASVVHGVAQVEIIQEYRNVESNPIEATYFFPVDSNGAVTHFQAELDGRIIKGIVKPNDEARKDYDVAVQRGQTAFLGEETKPDVFKLKVGFLKPGSIAKVVIGYVTEVKNEPDTHSVRFVLPTTVAPRYIPHADKNSDLANMTFSTESPASMSIKTIVSLQAKIKDVKSLSNHNIIVEQRGPIEGKPNWNKAVITLAGNTTEMNRDFVLLVIPEEESMTPRVYKESFGDSVALMVHMIPSFALKEEKVEVIFVVDCSGSMQRNSIKLAGQALDLALHSLPANCCFNVIRFGSTFQVLFQQGSKEYNAESLYMAKQFTSGLQANLGGTEILQPLCWVYSLQPPAGYKRQVIVMTDGEVSNTEEVIGLVKRNSYNSRLFSLGIGASSSRHLVEGIAKAGGGTSAFVEADESIRTSTLSQLKNALQPALNDVKLEWLGIPHVQVNESKTLFGYNKPIGPIPKWKQSPTNIPPVFDGSQMIVLGMFDNNGIPKGVKFTADSPDGPLSLEISVDDNNALGSTSMLHKLGAIKIIRELELDEAVKGQRFHQVEIQDIGVKHSITSRYTSFIAVDKRNPEELVDDSYRQSLWNRDVPSQMMQQSQQCSSRSLSSASKEARLRSSDSEAQFHLSPYRSLVAKSRKKIGTQAPQAFTHSIASGSQSFTCFGSPAAGPQSFTGFGASTSAPQSFTSFGFGDSNFNGSMGQQLQRQNGSNFSFGFSGTTEPPGSSLDANVTELPQSAFGTFHRDTSSRSRCMPDEEVRFRCSIEDRGEKPPAVMRQDQTDTVLYIIGLQNFDGSFKLTEDLLKVVGLETHRTAVVKAFVQYNWTEEVWITGLVITFFRTKVLESKDTWELAVLKAEKWIRQNFDAPVVSTVMEEAYKIIQLT